MINKSQQFAILGILFLLVSSCSNQQTTFLLVQPTAYPSAFVADYFPLAQGSYWVYEGNVKWQVNSDVFEKTMQWKMEVVDVVKRNDVIGFKMLGAPWDLEFYDDGKKPSEYSFIKVGSSRYYEGTVENYYRMMDENDLLRDLVTENDLFLDIPLVDGEKFCDAFNICHIPDKSHMFFSRGNATLPVYQLRRLYPWAKPFFTSAPGFYSLSACAWLVTAS